MSPDEIRHWIIVALVALTLLFTAASQETDGQIQPLSTTRTQ